MNTEYCISILSIAIGIIAVLVAVVAIMFGYNLTIFRKKMEKRIKDLREEINSDLEAYTQDYDKKLSKCQRDMVDFGLIQKDIILFIDMEIKSGLASLKNGMMSLSVALRKSAELENPYISASVLNQLTKVLTVTSKDDFVGRKNVISLLDAQENIGKYVEKNIKILENSNMLNLLVDTDDNPQYVRECINKLIRVYQ